jgi:hypothetical protein
MFPEFLGVPRNLVGPTLGARFKATRSVGGAPTAGATGFRVQPQTQGNWCWAAVSTSVSLFYSSGGPWTQCSVADAELGRIDCCGSGASGPCDIPWYLDRALTRVGCFAGLTASASPVATVQAEVAAVQVLCLRIGWYGGGGHFMAIAGWFTGAGGVVYIEVEDPISGTIQLPYTTLVSSYQNAGRWTHSYLTIASGTRSLGTGGANMPAIRSPKGG